MRATSPSTPRPVRKRPGLLAALVAVILLGHPTPAGPTPQERPEGTAWIANDTCPVLPGEAVDETIFLDHGGRRIFFCCERCLRLFEQDPAAYAENLEPQAPVEVTHGGEELHAPSEATQGGEEHPADSEGSSAADHDHAQGHGDATGIGRAVQWLGKFHPLVVHFPIALAFAAALAEALFLWRRAPAFRTWARFNLGLATAGALAAVPLGWALAASASYPAGLAGTLGWHRWLGVGSLLWLCGTVVVSELARRTERTRLVRSYRAMLFGGLILIAATGHLGATLVFGRNYFDW